MAVTVATNTTAAVFLNALKKMEGDKEATHGAGLLFFYEKLGTHLEREQQVKWSISLGVPVLDMPYATSEKIQVIYWWNRLGTPETIDMLRKTASGEVGTEANWPREYETYADNLGTHATACLLLALKGDHAAPALIDENLATTTNRPDQLGLETAGMLTGKSINLTEDHFDLTDWVEDAIVPVIENNPTQANLDLLVEKGIGHDYPSVSHPAVHAFARIMKLDLIKPDEAVKPDHKAAATEWWKNNRDKLTL